MLPSHAIALAEARSCLAALADTAVTFQASVDYERVLLQLDWIHGDDVPGLDASGLTDDRNALFSTAEAAIEELVDFDVDALQIELVLAISDDVSRAPRPPGQRPPARSMTVATVRRKQCGVTPWTPASARALRKRRPSLFVSSGVWLRLKKIRCSGSSEAAHRRRLESRRLQGRHRSSLRWSGRPDRHVTPPASTTATRRPPGPTQDRRRLR